MTQLDDNKSRAGRIFQAAAHEYRIPIHEGLVPNPRALDELREGIRSLGRAWADDSVLPKDVAADLISLAPSLYVASRLYSEKDGTEIARVAGQLDELIARDVVPVPAGRISQDDDRAVSPVGERLHETTVTYTNALRLADGLVDGHVEDLHEAIAEAGALWGGADFIPKYAVRDFAGLFSWIDAASYLYPGAEGERIRHSAFVIHNLIMCTVFGLPEAESLR